MGTKAINRAYDKAVTFLGELIEEHHHAGVVRLPVMHDLARQARVSVGTMSKAVAALCRNRVLTASQRRGIIIRPSAEWTHIGAEPADEPARTSPRITLADQMETDIQKGVYAPGSRIPTFKELSAAYRTSGRSLRTAMTALVNRGVVFHDGRGFRVSAGTRMRDRGTIALIMRGHDTGEMLFTSSRVQEQLSTLERECSKANVELRIVICNFHGIPFTSSGRQMGDLRSTVKSERLLGCIVWSLTFTQKRLAAILHEIAPLGKPMAVLDENGMTDLPAKFGITNPVGIFGMSFTRTPGIEIGRHLCELGHRKAAFFSPFHSNIWSVNRLAGLRHAFDSAGLRNAVTERTTSIPYMSGFMLTPAEINAVIARYLPSDAAQELTSPGFQRSSIQPFSAAVYDYLETHRIRKSLAPLFDATLKDSEVTAWVTSNDIVGTECLSYLRSKGHAIPQEITVVSFDDSPLAALHRLSSYNFNCPAVMHAMVEYLLDKRVQWKHRNDGRPIEIKGFITVRESCAKAANVRPAR